jgi:SPOR domain
MADRYQDRPFPADDNYDRGDDQHAPSKGDSDPLAELARLIGQTDPFAMGRANQQVASRGGAREPYQPSEPAEVEDEPVAGPPPWMQRASRQEAPPQQDYPSAVHPLQRYATPLAEPEPDYHPAPPFADDGQESDPSRYDDALYGPLDSAQDQHDPAYPDDPYAYQDEFGDSAEEPVKKRGGGMMTVVVVLALAVLGTGAAFAYRTYVGSPRSGDVPVIKADPSPTKVVPTSADGAGKVPDRMTANDGTEKIVPREEAPVDVNAKSGPRVVLQPMNPGAPPPAMTGTASPAPLPAAAPTAAGPATEPRKIKTFAVPPDQANGAAALPSPVPPAAPPPAKPAPAARTAAPAVTRSPSPATAANASANAPLSLSPQAAQTPPAAEPRTRVAAVTPAPAAAPAPAGGGGGYVVQVSSQKSEADAHASYRVLQGKYPSVLGSQSVLVKRVDLGEKGTYYRAFAGPFSSADQAAQVCSSLKAAGGPQCLVQRN